MNRRDSDMHRVTRGPFRNSTGIEQPPSQFSRLHRGGERCQRRERSKASPRSLGIADGGFFSNQLGYHEVEASAGGLPPIAGSLLAAGDHDVPSRPRREIADNGGLYVDPRSCR